MTVAAQPGRKRSRCLGSGRTCGMWGQPRMNAGASAMWSILLFTDQPTPRPTEQDRKPLTLRGCGTGKLGHLSRESESVVICT